jgi:hypothetical protein
MPDEPVDILDPKHPLFSAVTRLRRGHEHVTNLDRQLCEFRYSKPHELVREIDPANAHYHLLKLKFTKQLPVECTLLAAEALESLRFTLDQVAYAAAVLSGKVAPKKTSFPISDSPNELDNLINGRKVCRDVPDDIVSLFRSFKPYKGADNTLWAMNKLRNSGHTALIPVGVHAANILINHHKGSAEIEAMNPVYDSTKNEIVFGRVEIGQHLNYSIAPSFNICFEQTEITKRQYAPNFLYTAVSEVHGILLATEAECRRLGFLK